jgi:hypothetical protein
MFYLLLASWKTLESAEAEAQVESAWRDLTREVQICSAKYSNIAMSFIFESI